jgi:hypothetical protein
VRIHEMKDYTNDACKANMSPALEAALSVSADILDQMQDTLKGARIKRVKIKLGKHTLREIPIEAAALSAILIAAAAVIVSQLKIEVER